MLQDSSKEDGGGGLDLRFDFTDNYNTLRKLGWKVWFFLTVGALMKVQLKNYFTLNACLAH